MFYFKQMSKEVYTFDKYFNENKKIMHIQFHLNKQKYMSCLKPPKFLNTK